MTTYFFPGCKNSAKNPAGMAALKDYLAERFGVVSCGCCSVDYGRPAAGDEALFQCPTCGRILSESSRASLVCSVYELLLEDERFPWIDCGGEAMTVQDCWRSRHDRAFCDAVRACLKKMNVTAVELENNYERADFCGPSMFRGINERYPRLAPQSLCEEWTFPALSEEEQRAKVLEHARCWTTEKILVTCCGCAQGVEMAGRTPVHLIDLVASGLTKGAAR